MAKHKRTPAPSPSRVRLATATAVAAAFAGGLVSTATGTAVAADSVPDADGADFNNDGLTDAVVSAAGANVGGRAEAGQIVAIYGGTTQHKVAFSQNSAGVSGGSETDDNFGADFAHGDFNSDGFDDLAVGTPGEDVGTDKDGGLVQILWGSANGLSGGTTVDDPRPTKHDTFGSTLEAGDFDGDGKDDLAVGSYGSATVDIFDDGIAKSGDAAHRYTLSVPVMNSSYDAMGTINLHSGDINGDKTDDLLVDGFSLEDGYQANYYFPGTANGVTTSGLQKLPGGYITDVGDTDKDGYGDVVIGMVWDDDFPGANKGGTVHIVHGSATGADGTRQAITQDTTGVPGSGETEDFFGHEVELGDINGDGNLDLVVGSPGENLAGVTDAGAVTVLYGAADGSGITGEGAKFLDQNTAGVPNSNEKNDYFGSDVHLDDLNGDGRNEVLIGARGENTGNGAVYLLNSNADDTLTSPGGIYPSGIGVSTSGYPRLGGNFAD
ncbi:FG-GAP repeat protein [Streptomyces sp. NPDC050418]|uniref:FG-GAP repeat protein n=1 Tax=Streptomyces sp. NPDC050418 TaxID=3365612 RepID=UPI00379A0DDB